MQENFAPDAGRPTVVATKIPADLVETIDSFALRQLLCRSAWLRKAILAQIESDAALYSTRPDVFGLAEAAI